MKLPRRMRPYLVVGAAAALAWWFWWRKPAATSSGAKKPASRNRKTDSGGGGIGVSAGVPAEQLMSVDYGAELLMSIEPDGNGPV